MPDHDAEPAQPQAEIPAGRRPRAPGLRAEAGQCGQPDKGSGLPEAGRAPATAQHIAGVAEHAVLVLLGGLDRSRPDDLHPGLDRADPRVRERPPDRGHQPFTGRGTVGQDPDNRARRVLAVPAAPAPDQPERPVEDLRPIQPRRYGQRVGRRVGGRLVLARAGGDHDHPAGGRPGHPGRGQDGRTRIDENQPQEIGSSR